MRVKVDSNEVELLTKKLDDYILELYSDIKDCTTEINNISEAYKTSESGYVIETCSSYFENLQVVPYTLNEINSSIKKANNLYDEKDQEFKKEIQKENEEVYKDEHEELY